VYAEGLWKTKSSKKSLVRMRGLEPPLLSKPEPKSGASANFATSPGAAQE